MFSCLFVPLARHRIQFMFPICCYKELWRYLDRLKERFAQESLSKSLIFCQPALMCNDGGPARAMSCMALQSQETVHVQYLTLSNSFTGRYNSLKGADYFLWETMNSLWGTNSVFRNINLKSLRGCQYWCWKTMTYISVSRYTVFQDTNDFLTRTKYFLLQTNTSNSESRNIINSQTVVHETVHVNNVNCLSAVSGTVDCDNEGHFNYSEAITSQNEFFDREKYATSHHGRIARPRLPRFTRTVRDREPSRLSSKKILNSLKRRKSWKKRKFFF